MTKKEEPMNDDLKQEIQKYLKDCLDVKFPTTDIVSIKKDVEFTARHFAKWQEEKDKEILKENGLMIMPDEQFETMKRSLIKLSEKTKMMLMDSVEGEIVISHGEKVILHPSRIGKAEMSLAGEIVDKYGIGDKVKIIIIKED